MDGNVRLRVMAQMAQTAAYLECPCQGKAFSGLWQAAGCLLKLLLYKNSPAPFHRHRGNISLS